jgi:tRNA(Ile2) C34 agmatinyltransferase TiaS
MKNKIFNCPKCGSICEFRGSHVFFCKRCHERYIGESEEERVKYYTDFLKKLSHKELSALFTAIKNFGEYHDHT